MNIFGKFEIYVAEPGIYKLEVFHLKYYFEPVIVQINENEDNNTKK